LNPHAGEQGLFGREEEQKIVPGIQALRKVTAARISGPHSPDAVFGAALKGVYDGVLCLYHDQGLIPFKLVAFEEGVNLTWGLPFIRVSPDHGTAFDIAGKGVACSLSMESAIRLAVKLLGKERPENRSQRSGKQGVNKR
jgi:4-hydroxythreonine-4-phosphate dehydrogenase